MNIHWTFSSKNAERNTNGLVDYYVIRPSQVFLCTLFGYNTSISNQFIHLFDACELPENGFVPTHSFTIAPLDNYSFVVPNPGAHFARGLVIAVSTNGQTLTLGGKTVTMFGVCNLL